MDLIKAIEKYAEKNKLLEAQVKSLKKWKKLEHNKSSLETILAHNIVKLAWKPEKTSKYEVITATSNTRLIKVYEAVKKEDKIKLLNTPYDGIYTRDSKSVFTYDLKDKTYKTVNLRSWKVLPLIEILPDDILVLDKLINEYLK